MTEKERVRCPKCWKRVSLRRDGKLPVHRRPAKDVRYHPPCEGSEQLLRVAQKS